MIDLGLESELLEARRAIRRQILEYERHNIGLAALLVLVAAGLALWSSIVPDGLGIALLMGVFGIGIVIFQGHLDRCPRCEGTVDVFDELHCARCGEFLEDVPHLPPDFEEELEDLEEELAAREQAPVEVADGVEVVA